MTRVFPFSHNATSALGWFVLEFWIAMKQSSEADRQQGMLLVSALFVSLSVDS